MTLRHRLRGHNLLYHVLSKSGVHDNVGGGLNFSTRSHIRGVHHVTRVNGLFISAKVVAVTTFVDPNGRLQRVTTHVVKVRSFLRVCIDAPLMRYRGHSIGKLCTGTHQNRVGGFAKVSTPFRTPRRPTLSLSASGLDLRRSIGALLRLILPVINGGKRGVWFVVG